MYYVAIQHQDIEVEYKLMNEEIPKVGFDDHILSVLLGGNGIFGLIVRNFIPRKADVFKNI